jgi:2-methylcitrate dehydratase PrpD
MNTIQLLADHLSQVSVDQLPDSALSSARQCLLDALGCAAAGRHHPAVVNARSWAKEAFAGEDALIWFSTDTLAARGAAFVNAFSTSIMDLDDGHRAASGHPGAAVVPAVLTVAQSVGASLSSVLVAIACGYEAGLRTARARNPALLRSVATGRWTAVAVAGGVGKLLGLAPSVLAHALAIAENQAPNVMAADHAGFAGSDVKEGIPWSVLTGISAVEQAMHGLRGYLGALDNPEIYVPGEAASNPGQRWLIETTYFKRYGCCRWMHGALDAVLEMRGAGLAVADIERVEVGTFARAFALANDPRPTDVIAAQFSIPFCMAVALIEGVDGLLPLAPGLLLREDIRALAKRVELRCDLALNELFPAQVPARVTVWTAGASAALHREVLVPLGDPLNPLRPDQMAEKMSKLLSGSTYREPMKDLVSQLLAVAAPGSARDTISMKMVRDFIGVASGANLDTRRPSLVH